MSRKIENERIYCLVRLKLLNSSGLLTVSDVREDLEISRKRAKKALDKLVDEGIAYRQYIEGQYYYIHKLNIPKDVRKHLS